MQASGITNGHAHRSRKGVGGSGAKSGPVRRLIPNPIEWKIAQTIAGGKVNRLFTVEDGVIIANSDKRPAWLP